MGFGELHSHRVSAKPFDPPVCTVSVSVQYTVNNCRCLQMQHHVVRLKAQILHSSVDTAADNMVELYALLRGILPHFSVTVWQDGNGMLCELQQCAFLLVSAALVS